MYDINFFKQSYTIKKNIICGKLSLSDVEVIDEELEKIRSKIPHIFNIETTNYCNMKCVMCPRTIYMKRRNIWIDDKVFQSLVNKIKPYTKDEIEKFWDWLENKYEIKHTEVSENGFYFSIVSRCLILHGYGEPFLDKKLIDRIKLCTEKNIPTYFSCTPANMTPEKADLAMAAGLTVLKFSIDGLSDDEIKKIRGKKANYTSSIQDIIKVIEIKKKKNYKTLLVPCMIDFSTDNTRIETQKRFLDFWKDYDVFAYIKSQDNRWLFEEDQGLKNKSHYAKQYCEYPWSSTTVMADGNVVPCTQISNNEIVFGNIKEQSLEEIWNGKKYQEFRAMHISGKFTKGHKCSEHCDQIKLHQYLNKKKEKLDTKKLTLESNKIY